MAGSRQKHPSALVGHRAVPNLPIGLVRPAPVEPPPLPAAMGLSKGAQDRWREIWNTPQAAAWEQESVYPLIAQYIVMYDTWLAWARAVKRKPFTAGSMGQVKPNPLITEMRNLEVSMRNIEKATWLSPQAAIVGGIKLLKGQSEMEKMNAAVADAAKKAQAEEEGALAASGWTVVEAAEGDEMVEGEAVG